MKTKDLRALKSRELQLKKNELRIKQSLPHIHKFKFYKWAREFYESSNDINLLCAANQISKSSTQIRKCIEWSTNKALWPKLWPGYEPNQFWYLYPSADVATAEFKNKWMQFMPAGELMDHPVYGWKADFDKKKIKSVKFHSGVTVYFKTYAQDVQTLQSGTVFSMFTDEELPESILDELMLRLAAVDGYFHMVFTATLNQEFWKRAIEPSGRDDEVFPQALKIQVSMYDCLEYEDGDTGTPWTEEKIARVKAKCKSQAEIDRRVYGRFVSEEGRIFGAYDPSKHLITPVEIPPDWHWFSGTDIGSGGDKNHPAGIVFIAIRPDYQLGYVAKCWRGDDGIERTAGDVFNKNLELRGSKNPIVQSYDGASKDFGTISTRSGESFVKAEKSHELGEQIINTLFKNDMLFIFDDEEGQGRKLSGELYSLMRSTPKRKRKDDLADATRYCGVSIPWDFESVKVESDEVITSRLQPYRSPEEEELARQIAARRGEFVDDGPKNSAGWGELDDEIAFWNEQY